MSKWVDTNRSVVGLLGNANLGTPANPRSRSGLDWIGSASIYDSVDPSSSHQVGRRFYAIRSWGYLLTAEDRADASEWPNPSNTDYL